ncbi:MAG: hypothetical protein U0031_03805 [Thermomicrobiales bacterium]
MKWATRWTLAAVFLGLAVAPAAAQGFSEVDSFVWIEGTIDDRDLPYIEAIVFVGNGGKTGRRHEQVNCNLFFVEHDPPRTKVSAYCESGRKVRGAKAYLWVRVNDTEGNPMTNCQSPMRELRRYSVFACTFDESQSGATNAKGREPLAYKQPAVFPTMCPGFALRRIGLDQADPGLGSDAHSMSAGSV